MNDAAPAIRTRKPKDGPFIWQSKAALDRIAAACDNRTDKPYVLAVYLAMSWQASDERAETFTLEKQTLAGMSGVGYRKIAEILKLLTEIGVITSTPNYVAGSLAQGPNTYSLPCTPPCTVCTPPVHGTKTSSVPRLYQEVEKGEEGERQSSLPPEAAPEHAVPSASCLAELQAEAEADGHGEAFIKWHALNQRKGWKHIKDLRAALSAFIEHISPANQCTRAQPANRRTGRSSDADHAKGF
jgi:hypothetical protein